MNFLFWKLRIKRMVLSVFAISVGLQEIAPTHYMESGTRFATFKASGATKKPCIYIYMCVCMYISLNIYPSRTNRKGAAESQDTPL